MKDRQILPSSADEHAVGLALTADAVITAVIGALETAPGIIACRTPGLVHLKRKHKLLVRIDVFRHHATCTSSTERKELSRHWFCRVQKTCLEDNTLSCIFLSRVWQSKPRCNPASQIGLYLHSATLKSCWKDFLYLFVSSVQFPEKKSQPYHVLSRLVPWWLRFWSRFCCLHNIPGWEIVRLSRWFPPESKALYCSHKGWLSTMIP